MSIKNIPLSEMEDSFLKQGVLKYGMEKWTLAVRAKKLFK